MRPSDLVTHPTDGTFIIEAVSEPTPLWPLGRAKRADGPWYPCHTLTVVECRWPDGTLVELGQQTDRGVITELNKQRRMVALNRGKLIWPINLLMRRT